MEETSNCVKSEYFPPHYMFERGAVFIDKELYKSEFVANFSFPLWEEIPYLSCWEALKLFQFEAPNQILGNTLKIPSLDPSLIVASSEGNFIEQTSYMSKLFKELSNSKGCANLGLIKDGEKIISFYLDLAGFPEWKALYFDENCYSLFIQPNYVIQINY